MVHRLRTAYCKLHRFHHGNAFVSPIISERSEEMPVGIRRQHTRLNRCVFGFICCCLFFKSALLVTIRHSTGNSAEPLCFFQLTLLSYSNFWNLSSDFPPNLQLSCFSNETKFFSMEKKKKTAFFEKNLFRFSSGCVIGALHTKRKQTRRRFPPEKRHGLTCENNFLLFSQKKQ